MCTLTSVSGLLVLFCWALYVWMSWRRFLITWVLKFYNTAGRKMLCREGRGGDDNENLKRGNGEDKAVRCVWPGVRVEALKHWAAPTARPWLQNINSWEKMRSESDIMTLESASPQEQEQRESYLLPIHSFTDIYQGSTLCQELHWLWSLKQWMKN